MNPLARKALLLALFSLLLGGETAYFGRACGAAVLRQRGERAFYRNDHRASWGHYRAALAWGGDPERLRTDLVELLLFGLDQSEAGIRIDLPVPAERAVGEARDLIAPCLIAAPYKAYYWSLASDIYLHEAEQLRREKPLDLQDLSEDPLQNLTPPQWLAVAALETSARLEPSYYIYNDLLTEMFLDIGSPQTVARYCRRAVAAYPALDSHSYLSRPDLPPEVLEAAVHGFEDAVSQEPTTLAALLENDAARLLAMHGQRERAAAFLRKALEIDPGLYDARFRLGLLAIERHDYQEAMEHFQAAAAIVPDSAWPHYEMGVSHAALGDLEAAIREFRVAREKDPRYIGFFHALGESLEKAGLLKEAERQFRAAANLNSQEAGAWSILLAFYIRHDDVRSAGEVCARLLALNPGMSDYREQCAALATGVAR